MWKKPGECWDHDGIVNYKYGTIWYHIEVRGGYGKSGTVKGLGFFLLCHCASKRSVG